MGHPVGHPWDVLIVLAAILFTLTLIFGIPIIGGKWEKKRRNK